MPTRNKPPDMMEEPLERVFDESDDLLAKVALDIFARLIEILAKQGTLNSDEVDALVEIAKKHMRE